MNRISSRFIKGIVQDDSVMNDGIPQVAFIGRSNVGKSSLINTLTKSKISRISSSPGSTREINFYLINESLYFVDLPGYGYARASGAIRDKLSNLIDSYLFNRIHTQKCIVLIIDVNVGMTTKDIQMFNDLKENNKNVIVALSKVDKITQKDFHHNIKEIEKTTGAHELFQFSSKKGVGIEALINKILE